MEWNSGKESKMLMSKTQADLALDCADEMAIKASEYRQMGLKELARFLSIQAKNARKWACRRK